MMLGSVVAVGLTLMLLLSVFWILEIAPIVLFVGMAVFYGLLANRSTRSMHGSNHRFRPVGDHSDPFNHS